MKILLRFLLSLILFVFCSHIKAQEIFQAIQNGEYEKVEQLISIEPNLVDTMIVWNTPLIMASYFGKDKIVELLLNHGANMYKFKHKNGRTALHLASMQNHPSVVDVLIRKGVDVNVKDGGNKTALIYAIENNNRDLIDLLLMNKAKLPEEQELMNLCLHSTVLYGYQDIAEELLKNGASLSSVDHNGQSLLHIAVLGNNLKWIDLLSAKNIAINKLDSFNRTPLHYSVELNQFEITKSLIKNGAEVNIIDCTNRTPLAIAQGLGYIQISDFLESKGGMLSEPKIIQIAGEGNKKSEIKVTYIANMGVLISSASKTILIDGLFNESYNMYPTTPKNIVSKINNFEPPFNSIDLILVTHGDGDHFSAPMIAEYLALNKSVKVVCNNNAASALKENIDSSVDSTRIVGITPELCKSADTLVNDIKLKVLRLRHSGSDDQSDNIGFLIEMDGLKVFHQGDAGGDVNKGLAVSGIQEYDSIDIAEMKIDLAILNRGSLWYSGVAGLQIIKDFMKPKYIILTHFSENNKQGEWVSVDQTIKENKDILPELTIFKWKMQNIIIHKGF